MAGRNLLSTAHGTSKAAFGRSEWAMVAAMAAMWGASFVLIAEGLEAFPPFVIAFLRIAIGAITVGLFARSRARVGREAWPRLILLGITWLAIPMSLFPIAQQSIDSSVAGMLNGSTPIFAAVVAALLLWQAPTPTVAGGVALGFLGVVLISFPSLQGARAELTGVGLVLVAAACYGLSVNLAVPLQQRYGALPVIFRTQLVGAAFTLPIALGQLSDVRFQVSSWIGVTGLGVFGTGLAFIAMVVLAGRVGGPRASIATYFVPIVAITLGAILRDEQIRPISVVGMFTVMAGAYLASRRQPAVRPLATATASAEASSG